MLQLLEVRRILEAAATAMAAIAMSDEDIAGLGALVDSIHEGTEISRAL